jgi:phage tail sheath protein FI
MRGARRPITSPDNCRPAGSLLLAPPPRSYVNVRRLLLFVEESIGEGTQWAVFEANDEPLWAQVRQMITSAKRISGTQT